MGLVTWQWFLLWFFIGLCGSQGPEPQQAKTTCFLWANALRTPNCRLKSTLAGKTSEWTFTVTKTIRQVLCFLLFCTVPPMALSLLTWELELIPYSVKNPVKTLIPSWTGSRLVPERFEILLRYSKDRKSSGLVDSKKASLPWGE